MLLKKKIKPFSRLVVNVWNVKYDFSGMTRKEIKELKAELGTSGTLDYSAEELFDLDILNKDGKNWILDEFELDELISDRISSDTEMCHKGFEMSYSVS